MSRARDLFMSFVLIEYSSENDPVSRIDLLFTNP